jgi:dihydroorotase
MSNVTRNGGDADAGRELLLRGAHVLDPSQSLDGRMDVRIRGAQISEIGRDLTATPGAELWDLTGKYLCPGLIDLHGHWYEGSCYGIPPDVCIGHGVSAAVDAGTAGFVNFPEFRRNSIDRSSVRVFAFVNIAAIGIPVPFIGELEDLRFARPRETIEVVKRHSDVVVGIKLRDGTMTGGRGPEALTMALEAAAECRLPLMVHISKGADTSGVLNRLRPGDIVTHCFQGRGDGLLDRGVLRPDARAARNRGVLFDVGHGCGSFSWEAARRGFEHSFLPDTISTDLHRYSIDRWSISLPETMSKFLHLGMLLPDIVFKTTAAPASAIGRGGMLGTLRTGCPADVFIFEMEEGDFAFEDTHLKRERAQRRIKPVALIKDGHKLENVPVPLRDLLPCDRDVYRFVEETA